MIEYLETSVFNTDAQTIVNTVNCTGVMGAGLALEFKLRFPEMYRNYVHRCTEKEVKIGRPYLYRNYGTPWIMNFPTKIHWRNPSKIEWIQSGLEYFVKYWERAAIESIAFPKLGSDRGGLDWFTVRRIMEEYLNDLSLTIYICLDSTNKAEGVEGSMLRLINNSESALWMSLNPAAQKKYHRIKQYLPIKRFRDLLCLPGLGKKTYEDLFTTALSLVGSSQVVDEKRTAVINESHFLDSQQDKCDNRQIINASSESKVKNIISHLDKSLPEKTSNRDRGLFMLNIGLNMNFDDLSSLKWSQIFHESTTNLFYIHCPKSNVDKLLPEILYSILIKIDQKQIADKHIFLTRKGETLKTETIKKIIVKLQKLIQPILFNSR